MQEDTLHKFLCNGPKIAVPNCNLPITEARLNDGMTTDDDGLVGRSLAKDENAGPTKFTDGPKL